MEFGLLGPVAVWRDGREIEVGAPKQRALLAVLLIHAGETMARERLVDSVWGERPPATAVKALQVYVSHLRKTLGEGVLETRPLGYVLRAEDGAIDARRFESLLADGRRLLEDGAAREAGEVLREALGSWRGPALADFRDEPFARNEAARLDELRLVGLEHRLDADLAVGRAAEAVPELEALVREHPRRERLRGLLVLALYRAGRQADARAVMEDARAFLRDELGLDPSQALQQFEQAILEHDPALAGAGPVPAASSTSEAPDAGPSAETRKTVTVLSCEVVAGAEHDGLLDPEGLIGVTSRFVELGSEAIARHGGTVDRFVGGEGMAVFGVPVVREDDALRAARTAVELRERLAALEDELGGDVRLELRIGLGTGEVVAGDAAGRGRLVTGNVVAAARRLQQAAAPGEVLLAEPTYALLAHAVSASPLERGGARGGATAFRLDSVDPEATALLRRDDMPLVGRERELDQLSAVFADVARGGGARQATILGEPGIGKSRLTRGLLAQVAGEATVFVGRCPPYGEGVTFWPLRELLRQAGRDESALEGPTREVFAFVRHLLEGFARERPVIAVFDDVHWAEQTFLDLVEDLAARLGSAPVLLLCLARPQLAEARPAWLHEPAWALALEPLTGADSESLLAALGAPVASRARIAEAAEGNPLFVEQLAAIADEHGADGVLPTSIRGVLHERLDRLEREQRALLERAAVAGRSFTVDAVLELTPPEEQDEVQARLFALVRGKFVRADTVGPGDGFRFHHALIRDATYEGIPKRARADLHERIADWFESQSADDALVGYHLEQVFLLRRELGSSDVESGARAARLLRRAAQETFSRSDISATISLYERAQALVPGDHTALPMLLTELAAARMRLGDYAGAERDAAAAIEVAKRLGDRGAELHALIERQLARFFAGSSVPTESLRLAGEAMEEFERSGDATGLAKAWLLKANVDAAASRIREAMEATEQALLHARRANAVEFVNMTSGALAWLLLWGPMPVPDAIKRMEELIHTPESDRASRATLRSNLAVLLAMQGSFERARSLVADAVAGNDDLGLGERRAHTSRIAAEIEVLAGDPAAAEIELRAALDVLAGRGTVYEAGLRVFLAEVLYGLERFDEAEELARAAARSSVGSNLELDVRWRSVLGRLLARRGQLEEAERLVAEAMAVSDGIEEPVMRVAALTAAAEVGERAGGADEARRLLEEARAVMEAKLNLVGVARIEAALTRPVR